MAGPIRAIGRWKNAVRRDVRDIAVETIGTRGAARAGVFRYVEVEYHRIRLRRHPGHGHVTPLETRSLPRQNLVPAE
ncbi:hypothetical protein [Streptomyces sp. I6]|uniref:hypothetical protein n=1 Tax=Streptomyces sp. I6 TaxID=2483113 RepID=UPI000F44DE82|nr:hypothetical protein [Streptomyces sp. I6]RNL70309.1 hypothetical protein EBF04_02540 [Streptomyces sp. I6]